MTALEQRARLDPNRLAPRPATPVAARSGSWRSALGCARRSRAAASGPTRFGCGSGAGRRRVGPGPGRDRHPDRPRRGPAGWGVAARGGRRRAGRGAPTCCPARASCSHAAPARTGRTRASTPRRSATWWPAPWTPTRSRCCCCVAGVARGAGRCAPAAAPRGDRASRGRPHRRPTRGRRREAYRRAGAAARAAAAAAATGPAGGAAGRPVARRRPRAGGPGRAGRRRRSPRLPAGNRIRRRWPVARPRGRPGRRAARLLGTGRGLAALAASAGMPSRELLAWAVTWRHAGRGGLDALRTTWQPAADLVEGGPRSTGSPARVRCAPGATASRTAGSSFGWAATDSGTWFVRSGSAWTLDGPARGGQVRSWTTTRPAEPGWPGCRGIGRPAYWTARR